MNGRLNWFFSLFFFFKSRKDESLKFKPAVTPRRDHLCYIQQLCRITAKMSREHPSVSIPHELGRLPRLPLHRRDAPELKAPRLVTVRPAIRNIQQDSTNARFGSDRSRKISHIKRKRKQLGAEAAC